MNARRETIILAVILVGALLLGAGIAPLLFEGENEKQGLGEPRDITGLIPTDRLTAPGNPERGAPNGKFILVEFADFECSSCAKAQPILEDLLKERPDVRHIFRHCPVKERHPAAEFAAHVAETARLKGKFWEMHDLLYTLQSDWTSTDDPPQKMISLAKMIGLDGKQMMALDKRHYQEIEARIASDRRLADACSVSITPSFFLVTPTRTWVAVGPVGLEKLRKDAKYWQ